MSHVAPWQKAAQASNISAEKGPLEAALFYAQLGWPVLPLFNSLNGKCGCGEGDCRSPGKHPMIEGGTKNASTNPEIIRGWFNAWPTANVGACMGSRSDAWAIDIDPRHGGDETFDALCDGHELPHTIEQITGGGGRHLIFKYPSEGRIVQGANVLGPGVDTRSNGGYLVVYPSRHTSGDRYEWEASSDPFDGVVPVLAPKWLSDKAMAETANVRMDAPISIQASAIPLSKEQVDERFSALQAIPSIDYQVWIDVGMSLHSENSTQGFELWDAWSEKASNYKVGETAKKWDSFSATKAGGKTIRALWKLAYDHGWEGYQYSTSPDMADAQPRPQFQWSNIAEIMAKPFPTWQVKGIFPPTGLGVAVGNPGAGKTFAMLDLAMCKAQGRPWFDRRVKRGKVAYLALEGALMPRVAAYLARNEVSADDAERLYLFDGRFDLYDEEGGDTQALIDSLPDGLDLLIVDTLNRAMPGGDENSGPDIGVVLGAAKRIEKALGCFVLLVHHFGKDMEKGVRGHSSLLGAVDLELRIFRDEKTTAREIIAQKVRDGEDHTQVGCFDLDIVDLGPDPDPEAGNLERVTSCVIKRIDSEVKATKKASPLRFKERHALSAFHECFKRKKGIIAPLAVRQAAGDDAPIEGQLVVKVESWKEIISEGGGLSNGESDSAERSAFKRAKDNLVLAGEIIECEGFAWLTQKTKSQN